MGRKTERERELEAQCARFAIELAEARNERDAALDRLRFLDARGEGASILVTEGAAAAIVEIRDLYAKDGTDEDLLRSALHEIRTRREQETGRVSPAAIAMQSDALDAALQRVRGREEELEEMTESREAAVADRERLEAMLVEAQGDRDVAQAEARAWLDESLRLRGVIEAIAVGEEHVAAQDSDEAIWLSFVDRMLGGRFQHQHGWASVLSVADDLLKAHRKRWREDDGARSTGQPPAGFPIPSEIYITIRGSEQRHRYSVLGFEISDSGFVLDLEPAP